MTALGRGVPNGPARFHARVLDARGFGEIAEAIAATGSEPEGVGIMTRKARVFPIRLDGVSLKAAPLLKQELLAVGGDSAHARGIADHSATSSGAVLIASWAQYKRLVEKLERQPFGLSDIGRAIEAALAHRLRTAERTLTGLHRSVTVGGRTLVMGVVNVTPDSFSDGGRYLAPDAAIAHAESLVREGADLLDLGAESTRPGATEVSPDQEWTRLSGVLRALHDRVKVPISVDTRHPEVAERALEAGADLLNDVEGLRRPEMRRIVLRTGAPAIVLHMRGVPATMQGDTSYGDVRGEVFASLSDTCALSESEGIRPEQLLVDPGLGFGKTAEQSLDLLAHSGELRSLGHPVVIGASRKSFLGWALDGAPVGERLEASLAAAVAASLAGVEIVRVHDVAPTVRAVRLAGRLIDRPGRE